MEAALFVQTVDQATMVHTCICEQHATSSTVRWLLERNTRRFIVITQAYETGLLSSVFVDYNHPLCYRLRLQYKPDAQARELIVYPVFEGKNRSVMRFFPCLRCGLVPNVQLQNLRVGLVFPSAHPGALVTFVSKEPEAKIKLAGIVNENSKALASHCLLVLASTQHG